MSVCLATCFNCRPVGESWMASRIFRIFTTTPTGADLDSRARITMDLTRGAAWGCSDQSIFYTAKLKFLILNSLPETEYSAEGSYLTPDWQDWNRTSLFALSQLSDSFLG